MKLIYVTQQVVTERVVAMVVKDGDALETQLAAAEYNLRNIDWKPKLQRDKQGNPIFHQLGQDWSPYPEM